MIKYTLTLVLIGTILQDCGQNSVENKQTEIKEVKKIVLPKVQKNYQLSDFLGENKSLDEDVEALFKSLDDTARIAIIGDQIAKLLDRIKPEQIAIERVFAQQNLKSVMGVAQVSGVISYLAHQRQIPVTYFTPTEVKAAVTGSGRANKVQVTNMMMQILKLNDVLYLPY